MRTCLKWFLPRLALVAVCASFFAACATNPNVLPDPGSKRWYQQRMAEIETSKADGQLTEEQYITLKNQADATRAAHLNAMRRNDYPMGGGGLLIGIGHVHHHHR